LIVALYYQFLFASLLWVNWLGSPPPPLQLLLLPWPIVTFHVLAVAVLDIAF